MGSFACKWEESKAFGSSRKWTRHRRQVQGGVLVESIGICLRHMTYPGYASLPVADLSRKARNRMLKRCNVICLEFEQVRSNREVQVKWLAGLATHHGFERAGPGELHCHMVRP